MISVGFIPVCCLSSFLSLCLKLIQPAKKNPEFGLFILLTLAFHSSAFQTYGYFPNYGFAGGISQSQLNPYSPLFYHLSTGKVFPSATSNGISTSIYPSRTIGAFNREDHHQKLIEFPTFTSASGTSGSVLRKSAKVFNKEIFHSTLHNVDKQDHRAAAAFRNLHRPASNFGVYSPVREWLQSIQNQQSLPQSFQKNEELSQIEVFPYSPEDQDINASQRSYQEEEIYPHSGNSLLYPFHNQQHQISSTSPWLSRGQKERGQKPSTSFSQKPLETKGGKIPIFQSSAHQKGFSDQDAQPWNWLIQSPHQNQDWFNQKEEKPPVIIEDDIAIEAEQVSFRLGIRWETFPKKRWLNNTVQYQISSEYAPREYALIESALKTFQFLSCLKVQRWDGKSKDYLYIHQSKKRPGCWSYVGRRGGRQDLSLVGPDAKSCRCLCDVGRTLHEFMHALGFYHEHSRWDRDKYITIVEKNVKKGRMPNFAIQSKKKATSEFEYDYDSIMHYGPFFFSKDKKGRKTTIRPVKPGTKIGQRFMLSKTDCMKLNHQYGCFDGVDDWTKAKIQLKCGLLGFAFDEN